MSHCHIVYAEQDDGRSYFVFINEQQAIQYLLEMIEEHVDDAPEEARPALLENIKNGDWARACVGWDEVADSDPSIQPCRFGIELGAFFPNEQ